MPNDIGRDCSIDLLIDDIREELRDRPYELVSVAGGWQHRTRQRFAEAIRSVTAVEQQGRPSRLRSIYTMTAEGGSEFPSFGQRSANFASR